MMMDWCNKIVFPVRRVWLSVSTRVKSRTNGGGLLKLHNDVQSCGYEDVLVMWEMLRRTESELTATDSNPKRKQRPFWRLLVWSSSNRRTTTTTTPSSSFPEFHS